MKVGCYSMHLYCDTFGDSGHKYGIVNNEYVFGQDMNASTSGHFDGFAEFGGRTEADCLRQAKAAGWKLGRKIKCPACIEVGF